MTSLFPFFAFLAQAQVLTLPPGIQAPAPPAFYRPVQQSLAPRRALSARPAARQLPRLDLSPFSAMRLSAMPAASAREAGSRLMDQVLGLKSPALPGTGVAAKAPPAKAPALKAPFDPLNRPYSPTRLALYENDPERYAWTYLFGRGDSSPRRYELLVGLSVHEALEKAFAWMKQGRPGASIALEEVLAEYDKAWSKSLKEGSFEARDGWTPKEYKRRGASYIEGVFRRMAPFQGQGAILGLEETVLWTLADPASGKSYEMKGKIDRLMLEGDTIVIHDWKTHFDPPSLRQLERDDVQLGLYALGLTRGRPDLVSGRRIKLVWDFKEFSQEIVVDAAYLQKVERRALTLLRGIETLSERVEARRGEWLRRLDPKPDASALEAARSDADRLGEVSAALDEKQAALRGLRRRRASAEEALVRYARERGLSEVSGTRRTLSIITSKSRAIPTKAEDPEANDEAAAILKREGLYEKYSTLSPSELKRAAEFQGGEDYPVFQKLKPFLISGFTSSIEVEPARGPSGSKGVAKPKLPRESAFPEEAEPGLLSATQIAVFLDDKDEFVRRYLLRERSLGPKPMGFLAGSAIHKALEQLFKWVKGGREGKGILLKDLMGAFDQAWAESRSERPFEPDPGLTEADYIRGSKAYLKAMFQKAYPFDQGRPVYLERRMHFTLTDPRTGKIYRFQGIPDRVMIEGDAVAVRDWKSNFRPPSDEEVKAKDYQLGLYLLALRELFPDLMRGRKGRLVWDFKDKETVIEADDAYLADLSERLFSVLREMDKLKEDFRLHRSAWEERLRPAGAPEDEASAARKVDELSEIDARLEAAEEEAKALKGEAADLEARLAAFLRESGLARVQGSSHAARLIEKGGFYVPTKTREPKAYAKVVEILKAAGAWERYSMLDTAALKKAMADPRHPDQGAFSALKGLLRESTAVKTELSED